MKNTRFLELDSCRGIASLAVVLMHLIFHYDGIYGYSNFSTFARDHQSFLIYLSKIPVLFFFMISGYVITWTLENSVSVKQFAIFRIARLFPVYWVAVLLTSILLVKADGDFTFTDFFLNLTMFQNFFGVENIDPVYWSLAPELFFYVIIGLTFKAWKFRIDRLLYFAVIWLAASVLIQFFAKPSLTQIPVIYNLIFSTPFFVGGIGFYVWSKGTRTAPVTMLIFISSLVAGSKIQYFGFITSITLWMMFFIVVSGRARILNQQILLYLGRISYPLYLFHLAPGYLMIRSLEKFGVNSYLSLSIGVFGVIFFASLLHFFVETPGRRKIRMLATKNYNKYFLFLNVARKDRPN